MIGFWSSVSMLEVSRTMQGSVTYLPYEGARYVIDRYWAQYQGLSLPGHSGCSRATHVRLDLSHSKYILRLIILFIEEKII